MSKNGFTLIELLVTLTIVAVLTTIGFLTFREVLLGARDGKRQSDLRSIQSALEQYRTDLTFYPVDNGVNSMNTVLSSGGTFNSSIGLGSGTAPANPKTYLNQVPKDPMEPSSKYCYAASPEGCTNTAANKCTGYTLYAKLEKVSNTLICSGGTGNYSLTVTPP